MATVAKAFADVGLGHLEPHLDTVDRWERQLTDDEKQRLAFARVLLQKPRWVVVHEALDALDPELRRKIEALLDAELADMGVINIGRDGSESRMFGRMLRIVTDPGEITFKPAHDVSVPEPSEPKREVLSAE